MKTAIGCGCAGTPGWSLKAPSRYCPSLVKKKPWIWWMKALSLAMVENDRRQVLAVRCIALSLSEMMSLPSRSTGPASPACVGAPQPAGDCADETCRPGEGFVVGRWQAHFPAPRSRPGPTRATRQIQAASEIRHDRTPCEVTNGLSRTSSADPFHDQSPGATIDHGPLRPDR